MDHIQEPLSSIETLVTFYDKEIDCPGDSISYPVTIAGEKILSLYLATATICETISIAANAHLNRAVFSRECLIGQIL